MCWSGFKTFHSVVSSLKNPPSTLTLFFPAYKWAPVFLHTAVVLGVNLAVLAGIAVLLSASHYCEKDDLWPVGPDWREVRLVTFLCESQKNLQLFIHLVRTYCHIIRRYMALLPGRLECFESLLFKFRLFGMSLTEPYLNKIKSVKEWLPRSICAISIMTTAKMKFKV